MDVESAQKRLEEMEKDFISKLPENVFVRPDYESRIKIQISRAKRGINIIYQGGYEVDFKEGSFVGDETNPESWGLITCLNGHINNCKKILEKSNNRYLMD